MVTDFVFMGYTTDADGNRRPVFQEIHDADVVIELGPGCDDIPDAADVDPPDEPHIVGD